MERSPTAAGPCWASPSTEGTRVYACDAGNGEIVRWDSSADCEVVRARPGRRRLDTPNMLAFDPQGEPVRDVFGRGRVALDVQTPRRGRARLWRDGFMAYPNGCAWSPTVTATCCSRGVAGQSVFADRDRERARARAHRSRWDRCPTPTRTGSAGYGRHLWVTLYRPDGIVRIGPTGRWRPSSTIAWRQDVRRADEPRVRRDRSSTSPWWRTWGTGSCRSATWACVVRRCTPRTSTSSSNASRAA